MTWSSKKRSPPYRFRDKLRFVPTPRLAGWLAAGAPAAGIAYAVHPEAGAIVCGAWNLTLLALCVVDALSLPSPERVGVVREAPDRVDLGRPFEVTLTVAVDGSRLPRRGSALDDAPASFVPADAPDAAVRGGPEAAIRGVAHARETSAAHAPWEEPVRPAPQPIAFDAGGKATARYAVRPLERGRYALRVAYVRLRGPLGLLERQLHVPCESEVRVLPDLSGVRGLLASVQRSLVLDGKRIFRRPMSGTDFQGIRDYSPDDDPRSINWPATARALQTKVNVLQPERGKIVTLLVDCGRMMGVELEGQTKLDRSLEAALTLAAVALQRGDQVAAMTFAGGIAAYVPPSKGVAHLQTIVEAVYDARSDASESNYAEAFTYLARVQKKRSLLVLFTDMENALFESELAPYLMRLRKTHPILMLCLQDPVLFAWSRIPVERTKDAYIKSTAYRFLEDRRKFGARMASLGIDVLDVPANELATSAVNAYLEKKARDAL